MATANEISQFKARVGPDTGLTDEQISEFLDLHETLNAALSAWYESAAAQAVELVDTTEGSSSRKMSSVFTNALKLAQHYRDSSGGAVDPTAGRTMTRAIERD